MKITQWIILLAVMAACSTNSGKKSQSTEIVTELPVVNEVHPGKLVYKKHCLSCHQANAAGIPNLYPPLNDNEVVSGDKEALIGILLNGLSGEIKVKGKKYNGVMASYRNLSDKEIADVLNFLRSDFDNNGEVIEPAEVKRLRQVW